MTASANEANLRHRAVLAIAIPIVLSNVTEPLIGIVDTAVLGQQDAPHLIGAVAIGATIFSMLFWAFSFLRMGTSGLTAQADGARSDSEIMAIIARALIIAGFIGVGLIALQSPLRTLAFHLLQGSDAVETAAETYFVIRIWSAPAALANFAILGWFIGLRRANTAFMLQLILNGLNIILDVLFVFVWDFGIAGVAWGTVIAQYVAVTAGLILIARAWHGSPDRPPLATILDRARLQRTFSVNRDIMIRTLVLISTFAFFVSEGARHGDQILAANAVLYHFMTLAAYFLDGFAYAAETLVGHAVGARNKRQFLQAVQYSSLWAVIAALIMSLAFAIFGQDIINLMTVSPAVRSTAMIYLPWAAATPIISVACFQLDGIFIGATRTAEMRNMALLSALAFFAAWWLLVPVYGNHGLWASMIVLFIARAVTLIACYPRIQRKIFAE